MKHNNIEQMNIMFVDGDICIYDGDDRLDEPVAIIPMAKLFTPTVIPGPGEAVYPCVEIGQYWNPDYRVALPDDYEPLYAE